MSWLAGRLFALLALSVICLSASVATAADNAAMAKGMENLVQQAQKDGMTVVVIGPPQPAAAPAGPDMSERMEEMGLDARHSLKRILLGAPNLWSDIIGAVTSASSDGSLGWLWLAVATAIGGLLAGFLPAAAIVNWARRRFHHLYSAQPRDGAEKIGFLLFRAAMAFFNTALIFAVAAIIAIIFDLNHIPSRRTIFVIIGTFAAWRIMRRVILANLLAPDVPACRMVNLSDADAWTGYREWRWVLAVSIVLFGLAFWFERIGLARDSQVLVLLVTSLISVILMGVMTIRHRRIFAGVILGKGDPDDKPGWRRVLAATWHIIGLVYLAVAWVVTAARLLLDMPSQTGLIVAPAAAFIGGIGLYGVLILLIEYFFRARRYAHDRKLRIAIKADIAQRREEAAAHTEALAEGIPADEETVENVGEEPEAGAGLPQYRPLFKPLAQRAAAVAVIIAAVGFVLGEWGIRAGTNGNPVTEFMDILVVGFIAWVLYEALAVYVDAKLAEEGGGAAVSGPLDVDEHSAGHGASRLGTLLPLVRNVLSVTIVAVAGMIMLSGLGVDIAPLFAGAGVVGLAVGFGAQTLIRDIFSGGFFLFDDAFRKGEYIELGDIRGTVEKISLRSFQLRHHNGPLHTIPFGEIKQLTNYSRDWVIMKLPLRLTFDADVEKVRKLIKKLGTELLEHPEVGKNFLQPLKSQGVVEMDDSALIVRVKFMTKPGDQWVTRKVVYASVQELFRKEGIRFANKEVTVRIHDETEHPLTPHQIEAVGAAARRVIDEEGKRHRPSGDDR